MVLNFLTAGAVVKGECVMTRNMFQAVTGVVEFGSAFVSHDPVDTDPGPEPSMADQSQAVDCDINVLMARYQKTGLMPQNPEKVPRYLDLSDVPSFQDAMDLMLRAEEAFMSLPAIVRKEFDNDPGKFVGFAEDPENLGKMREWGLAPPEKAPDGPMKVEVVNPPKEGEPPQGGAAK